MGNGSSQSIVLGPPKYQASFPTRSSYHHDSRMVPKYVHPQNRVLPKPVVGQRLRSTDNGSILQTAGTIRGQRMDNLGKEDIADPEMMGILRKRSEMIEKENDCYPEFNLRNHRLFHSDPNIARRPGGGNTDEVLPEIYSSKRRNCNGGAATRASKLKYKKKSRAPEPPPLGSSLPRQLERRPQNSSNIREEERNRKNLACKCIGKTRAPQPPDIVVYPPPPPPLPSAVTTRTHIGYPAQSPKSHSELTSKSPSITRAVESRTNYEKNVHPLEKWRNCRSTGDIRIDEEEEPSTSRTTIFDSKKISDGQSKIPSYLPQKPDPFQKEIQAVTKKIAQSKQQIEKKEPVSVKEKKAEKPTAKTTEKSSPPKFYFSDPSVFKMSKPESGKDGDKNCEGFVKADSSRNELQNPRLRGKSQENTTVDEVVPSLQRFSVGRRRLGSPSRNSTPSPQQKAEMDWERLSKNLYPKQECDSDIDVRLRPVLPRKPADAPKFSPSEAWQALGSDGLGSSNQSTSDDGRDGLPPYKQNLMEHRSVFNDRPRRYSDMDYDRYTSNKSCSYHNTSTSDNHWTPRHDLVDDSDDVSSVESEEAVIPRIRPGPGEIPTRFSLPSVMFSNMRPIGSEIRPNSDQSFYLNDSSKTKQQKKKFSKRNENQNNDSSNFKRFLSKKNRYQSEEDIAVSDSNWTFGQQGLKNRGKQYSSDLMLSDKKKHELMLQNNFSDFLGDILMSKSNDMKNQMKSSDSGNSNFSFYSTEGQIMYKPERRAFVKEEECSPPTKGRVYDMRRKFDVNMVTTPKPNFVQKNKKKVKPSDIDLGRSRDLELAKMLEDEVRKRRNKEKINIRQQLQRMKHLQTDEDEEFDDEAYFTEPKSREESQSPFSPTRTSSEMGFKFKPTYFGQGSSVAAVNAPRLSHWQSSPALLEDALVRNGNNSAAKGRLSLSSVMSSPVSDTWVPHKAAVDTWLQKQQHLGLVSSRNSQTVLDQSAGKSRLGVIAGDDGDISSSPTPAPPKKEKRKTNIYKQLMDIVRKEERHLKNAQRGDPDSRDSSFSHCESSHSTCSESSLTSSYSYSDSSGAKPPHAKNGVPANKEFGYKQSPSFQVAFVQPYTPNKSYRPVPFDVVTSAAPNGYRLPGLQEERKPIPTEVA